MLNLGPPLAHQEVFHQAREKIEMGYLGALRSGYERPVVLVLDLNDAAALQIGDTSGLGDRLREFIGKTDDFGGRPLAVWHVPATYVQKVLADIAPEYIEPLGEDWGDGQFPTVIVADGMTSMVLTPVLE